MPTSDNDIRAYDNALKRIKHFRGRELTRRQVLKASAATALGATLASQFVPREVHADVGGTIVHFASSGKRLANSLRAVKPLFDKVFPNVTLEVVSKPMSEALTQINTYMRSKSDAFDIITQDHAQFAALDAMGALTDLGPYIEPFPDWYADYEQDTWDQVIDACKEIHDPDNERYAYCAAMQRSFWAGYQYFGALRGMGGAVFADEENKDYTVTLESEEAYQALKVLVELQKYAHPVAANAGEDEVNRVFAAGTALYSPLTWGTAVLNDASYTDLHEHWHMDLSPRGTGPNGAHRALAGGFGQFMPTFGGNRETAFAWIKFLNSGDREDLDGSPLIADAIVGAGGQLSRVSTLKRWSDRKPFFVGLMKAYPVADAVNEEQSIEDAMKANSKRVHRIMEDSGYYA
ncbi:hypothetical protein GBAR_LOCUS26160 [Geodia barretti]|uniref:Extracellular solute-binding protein n=1 Tax=Geodia barretti TaxID=519541 RepID=A0AA35TFH3_GEOBA|nr:hypothetical protein GBAR_LOCUS26160 [Geodia barretti]